MRANVIFSLVMHDLSNVWHATAENS